MKKIITIVGARPQFIKAAVLSREIALLWGQRIEEIIVHTGQHFDENMSDVFFNEMTIPKPKYQISISKRSHGGMTAEILTKIEEILIAENPDIVVVYGDTNSTLAGALAASKLQIPIAHIEAGLRSYNKKMPEEQNRIITDHLSTWLFCPTNTAITNLAKESIQQNFKTGYSSDKPGVFNVGDIMYEASLYYSKIALTQKREQKFQNYLKTPYILTTIHRAENTDNVENLKSIIETINKAKDYNFILPLHPRTKNVLEKNEIKLSPHIAVLEPLGFLDMIWFEYHCDKILTDSGGVQKEAYFFKKPCITLRFETEWVETVESGWNILAGTNKEKIISALYKQSKPQNWENLYGNGQTARAILENLI